MEIQLAQWMVIMMDFATERALAALWVPCWITFGSIVGDMDGCFDGDTVGSMDGDNDGFCDGTSVGGIVGSNVGSMLAIQMEILKVIH